MIVQSLFKQFGGPSYGSYGITAPPHFFLQACFKNSVAGLTDLDWSVAACHVLSLSAKPDKDAPGTYSWV